MMAAPTDIAHWRARIFNRLLQVVLPLGVATAVPSMLQLAADGLWQMIAVDIAALAWLLALWRLRRIAYTTRVLNFLAIAFVVGVALMLKVGAVAQIYLMAIPVLAALLLGLRPALLLLALTTLAVMVLGFRGAAPPPGSAPDAAFLQAAIITLNYLFIAAIITLSCAVLLQHLARSLEQLEASNAELRRSADDIHQLAFFDVLTSLPNRRLLMDRIDTLLAGSERGATFSAIVFIDLDRFKQINDARGHAIGDDLLRGVAKRLSGLTRKADTVARIGADEFVLLLAHLGKDLGGATHAALGVAEKVRAAIGVPFVIAGEQYACSASVGITLMPKAGQAGHAGHAFLREADIAVHRAKAEGRSGVAFFEAAMQADVERTLTMERDLGNALAAGALAMHMQLQVDRHGRAVGAELLMRWPRADGTMVPPAVFIPVAEECGLMVPLGHWALAQACEMVLVLASAGHALPLSVNVSPAQFREADFVARVRRTLADSGAPASMLILEVTEGLLVDNLDATIARMHELAALGLRFSIDDFGTGYSSLAYLRKMPLYELKIDRSFIHDTPADAGAVALVQTILGMAGHLGLRVVAEGVETQAQADFLAASGCDCMQGYLFARPQPLAGVLAQLAAAPALAAPAALTAES